MVNVVREWDYGDGQKVTQYDDGTFVWSTPDEPRAVLGIDCLDGSRCMSYADGVQVWIYPQEDYPQYACSVLYTKGSRAGVEAWNDKHDGSVLWKFPSDFDLEDLPEIDYPNLPEIDYSDLPEKYTACKTWPDGMQQWLTDSDSDPFVVWTNAKTGPVRWDFPPDHPQYQWCTVDSDGKMTWQDAQGNRYYKIDDAVYSCVGNGEATQTQRLVTRDELERFLAGDGRVEVNVYDPVDGGVMHADTHAIDRGNIRDNPGGRIELCSDTTDVAESAYDAPVHALTIDDESLTPNIYQDEVLVQINGRQHGWDVTERCGGGITSHIDVVPEASPVRTSFTVADLYNPNSGVRLVTHIDGEAIELKLVRGEKPKAPVIADDGRIYADGRTHAAGPDGDELGEDLAPGAGQVDQVDEAVDAVDSVADDVVLDSRSSPSRVLSSSDANPGGGRQWDRHNPLGAGVGDGASSSPLSHSRSLSSSGVGDAVSLSGGYKTVHDDQYKVFEKWQAELAKAGKESWVQKWYHQPLWRMQLTEVFMTVVDQLNGDLVDSFINYPFTGVALDEGAARWGEVVGHLQSAQVDSLQWSGSAAEEFTAQLEVLQDQIDPLAGVDKKFRSSMQDHAKQVMGFHITMWSLIYTMGAAIAGMTLVYFQAKRVFKAAAPPQVNSEFYARWMAYQYTLPKQLVTCATFLYATFGLQSWVWVSALQRRCESGQRKAQYRQAADATEFTQAGSAHAVVDSADGWATRVGSFGWVATQGSSSSSFAPASLAHRGSVAGPSRSGGARPSRPADAPIPAGVGSNSLLAHILGGLPSAPTNSGSGSRVSAPPLVVDGSSSSSSAAGVRPTSNSAAVSTPPPAQSDSGSNPPPPPRAPLAPPPVKKADATPNTAGQRAPVATKAGNPSTGLDHDHDADYDPEYDSTTGLLIG